MSDRHAVSPYPLRMPAELRAALEASAVGVGRSLHAEILARLEGALEAERRAVSDELVDTILLQASLTLALAKDLKEGALGADQRQALESLVRVSRGIVDRFSR